jgi:hypothetical protein
MVVLTIYTDRFDLRENVYGKGMSGKVFLEEANGNSDSGQEFKAVDAALDYCEKNNINIDRIDFHYLGDYEVQRFKKFIVQK